MSDFEQKFLHIPEADKVTVFAETNFRNLRRKFGIKTKDRRRHIYVIGKSGTGKTTLIDNLAYQDILNGYGLAMLDPHGELISHILDIIPAHRINDVVYFNPADTAYVIGFNPLELTDPSQKNLVASGLMSVFKKVFGPDVWSARMEYIMNNSILALLESPNSTLMGIMRLLVDKYYRKKVVDKVTDPVVRSFWVDEYEGWSEKFRTEAIAAIQNKIGQFLSSSVVRNIVCQAQSSINLREIMDEGKILLMDLSKGRIGDDNSSLLGAMMVTKLQLTAMSRINLPEAERRDFFVYVDEFQNFATESFDTILSEARKYHLGLVMAHQYIDQLSEEVRSAVFGNVGTLITFQIGAADAEYLEKEFAPTFSAEDFVNLGKYEIYLRLMIDGLVSQPFSATTLAPLGEISGNRDKVIRVARERYARPVELVEEKIRKWAMEDASVGQPLLEYKNSKEKSVESKPVLAKSKCWICQTPVDLTFIPDGIRPIYCVDCLKKIRAEVIPKAVKAPPGAVVEVLQADGTWQAQGTARPALEKIAVAEALKEKPSEKKLEPLPLRPVSLTEAKPEPVVPPKVNLLKLPKLKPWQKEKNSDDVVTPAMMKESITKQISSNIEKKAFESLYEDELSPDKDDFNLIATAPDDDDFKPMVPGQVVKF